MKYRIKKNLAYRKINNEIYIVDTKNSYLHKINEVGSFIFEKLKNKTDTDEIVNKLMETYDVDYQTALADLENFVKELISKDLIIKDAKK